MSTFPQEFLLRLCSPLSAYELYYAYLRSLMSISEIEQYITVLCSTGRDVPDISLLDMGLFATHASRIENLDRNDLIDIINRWAAIFAAHIYESSSSDKLNDLEDVYSHLDYPDILAPMIRYMPMIGPNMGSREKNEARMLEYLDSLSATIVDRDSAPGRTPTTTKGS